MSDEIRERIFQFSDFIVDTNSTTIADTFSSSSDIPGMLQDLFGNPEFARKLQDVKSEKDIAVAMFKEVDDKIEIDALNDLVFIAFLIGKAVPGLTNAIAVIKAIKEKM